MNILQRILAAIRNDRRSYDGAKVTARYGDFSRSNLSANAELDVSLATLRNRARGLYRNDPHVRRWVKQVSTNVVGDAGFRLQCRAKNNMNDKLDAQGNGTVEALWSEWAKACTVDGLMSFRAASSLAARSWARDGEVFCHVRMGNKYTHGMGLFFIEADLVDETLNKKLSNGRRIRQGIELDKDERPIAYHVLTDHPGETYLSGSGMRRYTRIPASQMIHLYIKDRPHQVRGEPPMVAVMTAAKMIGGYREAEVTGRRLAASKMGFFKRMLGQGSGDIAPIADTENADGELEMDVHPGRLSMLPAGVDFEKFDMTSFSTDYEQFERQILRSMAAGLDIAYSNIAMDSSNSSYSADRSDQIKQRDVWRELQRFVIEGFADRVKTMWMTQVFSMRFISLPSYRLDKFNDASYFVPRGWSWVDPEKEIKSAVMAVQNGITSLTRIAAEQGRDVEEVFKEIKSDEDLTNSMGLTLGTPQNVVAPPRENE